MKSLVITVISLKCIFLLSGCSTIFSTLYGIKNYKKVDENIIVKYSKKYNIPLTDSYELDTSYLSFLRRLDTALYKEQIKNHYQPLQALYYDNNGRLKSFQINCYVGGFPNLNWNRNDIMSSFPPKAQAPIDSIMDLPTQIKHLRKLSYSKTISIDNYDYHVIVYWNRFMGRQSKRLIRLVQQNSKNTDKKVKILYVNTDNIFDESNNK